MERLSRVQTRRTNLVLLGLLRTSRVTQGNTLAVRLLAIYIYIYRKPLQDKQGKYLATVCRSTGGWKLNKADQRGIIAASPPILISRARELAPSGHQSLSDDFSFAHVTRNIARLVLLATAFAAVSAFSRKSSWAGRDCVCVDAVQE